MASIDELKQQIDLHDLALALGFTRPDPSGNYSSPNRDDKHPSVSIYDDGKRWHDHATKEGGTCIDMVLYAEAAADVGEAVKYLHELYNIPRERPAGTQGGQSQQKKSRAEYVAEQCAQHYDKAMDYLTGRGIAEEVVKRAIDNKMLGFNTWHSDSKQPGDAGYGGPGVAFVVRTLNPGRVVGVDIRYLDPQQNGGVKTQCQGEKHGYPWYVSRPALQKAHTVYLVESPINAMSVESCNMKGAVSLALRGVNNADSIDWAFLKGKRVIICLDNDEPDPRTGIPPGARATWDLLTVLTERNIAAQLVDLSEWELNDCNDVLQEFGPERLKTDINVLDRSLIYGLPGNMEKIKGKPRIFLPPHDYSQYWRYRTHPDFTSLVKTTKNADGDEVETFQDLAGFRIAGISRVTIAGATSVMSGEEDSQPRTLFAVAVQVPRHGNKLLRKVFDDDRLHNVEQWKKFGPVYSPNPFLRAVNILERAAELGARDAVNFVGLAWRKGKLTVNEGPDCYFTEPDKQCPYHNLTFPCGSPWDARRVIDAYQSTFTHNAALQLLVWGLGGHLKALLGFWPHMTLQSNKGAGKSTLIKRLERSLGFTMFSGQSLQTEYRLLTSISHTSHPVGWEELSARRQDVIDKAVALLQENYQYTTTRRGSEMTEYLISAPVLLAGEDVPVRSLLGKVVRSDITHRKGPIMPEDLPRFPVKQWLNFLATLSRPQVMNTYNSARENCLKHSRATKQDDGATRMAGNYAALLTAWRLLCEFAGVEQNQGGFKDDLREAMNSHIAETSADREPWVWIMDLILSEIASGQYKHPFTWDQVKDENGEPHDCLLIRSSHVMDHISHTPALRDRWNQLPVKSDRVFRRQLVDSGTVIQETCERTINSRRVNHLAAVSLEGLKRYALHAVTPDKITQEAY